MDQMGALRDARKNVSYSESMTHASEYQFVSTTNMVYLKSVLDHAGAVASAASKLSVPQSSRELLRATCDIAHNSQQEFIDNLTTFTALREALDAELRNVSITRSLRGSPADGPVRGGRPKQQPRLRTAEPHRHAAGVAQQPEAGRGDAQVRRAGQGGHQVHEAAGADNHVLPAVHDRCRKCPVSNDAERELTPAQAMFSMPFLSLDDNLSFKAISKFWIFVVVSLLFTGLTFAASFSWDVLSRMKAAQNGAKQEEQDVDNAGDDLRPRPHVDVELSEMAKILMSRLPVKEGPDSDDDDDDEDDGAGAESGGDAEPGASKLPALPAP